MTQPAVMPGRGPMADLRARKKADTLTRLSVAAVELLVAEGLDGATVSAIAERAGVSTRTFHNYFAHREDAFLHFLREQVAEWVRRVDGAPAGMSPLDVLRSIFRESHGRSQDDIVAAENLLVVGEQVMLLLRTGERSCAANVLDPLYAAVQRRAPHLSPFRVRVIVDLGLAAGASVLRHQPPGGEPGGGEDERDTVMDEAFDLFEKGAGHEFRTTPGQAVTD
ncbi:TetR/AcrR family transcriptional regulator [Dietzia sp. DQ12-76]|nr:TetR/AcrR family transcriptional regulator [Dietzia sp. JS16-p6b]MBB1025188.1 TetR/AcrR family transcriptional regulator [Dietzia sp. DQ12-76]MBB1026127.1 TetR/AcrR family transcriptional regulator [Dietzia sp. DQ11-38-2]